MADWLCVAPELDAPPLPDCAARTAAATHNRAGEYDGGGFDKRAPARGARGSRPIPNDDVPTDLVVHGHRP